MNDKDKLKALRDLLFDEERKQRESLSEKIVELNDEIAKEREDLTEKIVELDKEVHDPNLFKSQVEPIVDDKINDFVDEMPQRLGPTITETLKIQIQESKDEVVEALYPIVGRMIKKYIQREIQLLSERVDQRLEKAFSLEGWWLRIKGWFTGVKEKDLIISDLAEPHIEEIFLVQKGSGILIGSYSRNKTLDLDMISGMLTAIKSFVEDAFTRGEQNLELIEYDLYKIHIQNFYSFYVAVVISGVLTTSFRSDLEDKIMEFVESMLPTRLQESNEDSYQEQQFSKELKSYFDE
ncbi:MAG: hypothetical protein OER04_04500 [Cyclobacteriaceae bacterium]|nr:hypothetical protein [Cyclobacteriaceae bacterium]